MNILEYIGRFHPVLVHLPIGILLATVFLEALSHVKGFRKVRKAVKMLLLLGFASAFFSSLTGWLHAASGEFNPQLVLSHRALAIVVTVLSLVALLLHGEKKKEMRLGYFIILFAMTILILLTGHSGGSLTHGADYLKPSWEGEEKFISMVIKPDTRLYADLVAPVFKKNCTGCHGPTRQKGKLRLDQPDFILKGGKDGDILLIGKGDEGEMWRRINLDHEDEDHMPPKEKTQLSKAEISLITYWLETGGDFNATLASLPRADSIMQFLEGEQGDETKPKVVEIVFPPDKALLNEFRQAGVTVSFLSQGDGRISLNFINADPKKLPALFTKLPLLSRQLVEVKLPGKKLSHDEWTFLKLLPELKRVSLENSNFSDNDLVVLNPCVGLTYINFVGTSVTTKGLMQLSLNKLQKLYLFRTHVKAEDLTSLQKHFPKTDIVLGNFQIPLLALDTTIQKEKYVVPK